VNILQLFVLYTVFLQTTNDQALLVVKDAKRADTGPYNVVLKNPSGSAEATVKVTVLGKYI